jgi:hypothetical protein
MAAAPGAFREGIPFRSPDGDGAVGGFSANQRR